MKINDRLWHKPSCPKCKKLLDGFTCVGEEGPTPRKGDVSICCYCSELLEFDEDLNYILITADALEGVDLIALQRAQRGLRYAQDKMKANPSI